MAFSCCYVRLMSTTCVNAAREAHIPLRLQCCYFALIALSRRCLVLVWGGMWCLALSIDTCCVMLCYVMLYCAMLSGVMLGCDVWQT